MRKKPAKIILECYIFKGAGLRRVSVCSFNWVSPGQKRTQFRTFRKHNHRNKQSVEPGHIDRVLGWWNSISMSFIFSLWRMFCKSTYISYIYILLKLVVQIKFDKNGEICRHINIKRCLIKLRFSLGPPPTHSLIQSPQKRHLQGFP